MGDDRRPREWVAKTDPDERIRVLVKELGGVARSVHDHGKRAELDALLAQEQVNATEELSEEMRAVKSEVGTGMKELAGVIDGSRADMCSGLQMLIDSLRRSREALCASIDKASASSTRIGTWMIALTVAIAFAATVGAANIIVPLWLGEPPTP